MGRVARMSVSEFEPGGVTPHPSVALRAPPDLPTRGRYKVAFRPELFRQVTNRLGVVAVWIEHEGPVIIGVVFGPKPGRTIVLAAGLHRRGIEDIDRCAARRDEGDMHRPAHRLALGDPERGLLACAEPDRRAMAA